MTVREKWLVVIIIILTIFLLAFYSESKKSNYVKSGAYQQDTYNQCRTKGGDDLGCWRKVYGE